MTMKRYLISIIYYHKCSGNYGVFRKKIYADEYNEAITKFKNMLNKKFRFGDSVTIKEISSTNKPFVIKVKTS